MPAVPELSRVTLELTKKKNVSFGNNCIISPHPEIQYPKEKNKLKYCVDSTLRDAGRMFNSTEKYS